MDKDARITSLKELLEKEPNDVFMNYVLGIEYQSIGKIESAKTLFLRVLELDPSYIPAYYQIGKLFESQNDNESAIKYFQSGLSIATEKADHKTAGEFREALFLLED